MERFSIPHRTPNEPMPVLLERALAKENAELSKDGALCVWTGERTGRSPLDRYIVDAPEIHDLVAWNKYNVPYDPKLFEKAWERALKSLSPSRPLFYSNDLFSGTHPQYRIPVDIYTEYASHMFFARTLIPKDAEKNRSEKWTMLNLPSLEVPKKFQTRSRAALWIDPCGKRILACGLKYAGEIKKAVFGLANYELPLRGCLTMHCSVVVTEAGKVVWLFGLSGTEKTTHATSEKFFMVGDDMFAYSPDGITSQLEDGCYPSIIKLSRKNEPAIWDAVNRYGAMLENIVMDENRVPDFNDGKFTQNTRGAYPLAHIPRRTKEVMAGKPDYLIFLTCDSHGILPPLSILKGDTAAVYHYLSGYTSKAGRTLSGAGKAIEPTFSSYFGEDFYPLKSGVYVDLFTKMLRECKPTAALINTGYTGGAADDGTGKRFEIPVSREVINAIVEGRITASDCTEFLPEFNLFIPRAIPNVKDEERDPRIAWAGRKEEYAKRAKGLSAAFAENWDKKFAQNTCAIIGDSGMPRN